MLSATSLLLVTLSAAGAQAPPAAPPPDQPFTRLFQNLADDIRALPSSPNGLILGIGGGGVAFFHPVDDNVSAWVAERGLASYTKLGRFAGDGWVQASIAAGTYAVGVLSHEPEITHIGSDLIRGQILNGIITRGLKIAVSRERPSGGRHAFPSGHSSASFLSASIVEGHYGWRAGLPAYATAAFISWSRVRDNAHWLTDVIGGATVGLIAGHAVTAGHRQMSWTVTPAPMRGGMAIYVTRRQPQRAR